MRAIVFRKGRRDIIGENGVAREIGGAHERSREWREFRMLL